MIADLFSGFAFGKVTKEPKTTEAKMSWEPLIAVFGYS